MTFILLLEDTAQTLLFLASQPDYMFANTNLWLIMTSTTPKLGHLFFPINSQVFTFQPQESGVDVWEVYNIDQSREQTIKPFGFWKSDDLEINKLPMFERRKDMEGFIFHGETMFEPPFIVGNDDDVLSGKQKKLGGVFGEVWHEVEKIMNFTTEIVLGDGWGSVDENGTWNGIIDSLIKNETQVGISDFWHTKSRDSVAAFSPPIVEGVSRMFIRVCHKTTFLNFFLFEYVIGIDITFQDLKTI